MFTASSNITRRNRAFGARSSAMLIAALVFANLVAIAGLGATARAADFPNALHYAPMTWEKQEPFRLMQQPDGTGEAVPAAAATGPSRPEQAQPANPPFRVFAEVPSEQAAPTAAALARAGDSHRPLLIVLMSIALATMGGVSVVMFRSLSRDLIERESRRPRF